MQPLHSWLFCLVLVVVLGGCKSGVGGDDTPAGQTIGASCGSARTCRPGLSCTDGTCQAAGTTSEGRSCILSAECAHGLFCNHLRQCATAGPGQKDSACGSDADCVKGLRCVVVGLSQQCRTEGGADLGSPCASARDCMAGLSCDKVCVNPEPTPGQTMPTPIPPHWAGADCEPDEGTARAYFELPRAGSSADFYRLPFPNDARLSHGRPQLDGHPAPTSSIGQLVRHYLDASEQDLDGFATNPVVFFRFSQPYDWDSVGAKSIVLVDITPDSPGYDHPMGQRWKTTDGYVSRFICDNWLAVAPNQPTALRPKTTYAALLTTAISPTAGGRFERDQDLEALLNASAPSDPELAAAHEAYAPLRAWLQTGAFDAAQVLNAAVFTTQDPERPILALREAVRADPVPRIEELTLCGMSATSPCAEGSKVRDCSPSDAAFTELHGKISLPVFQSGTAPYLTPADGGAIEIPQSGAPRPVRSEQVCFALTVPTAPEPQAGYPLLLYAHGTGGAFTASVRSGLAAALARGEVDGVPVPVASMTIDLPQHGRRRGDSSTSPNLLFYNFGNPRAARDNVLQGSADLMSLVYWAQGASIDAASSPTGAALRLDPERVALYGHSQGATHASMLLPFEPDLLAAVLSGNGGHLSQALLTKTRPFNVARTLPLALLDADPDGNLAATDMNPMLAILQGFFERSDPLNVAHRLRPGAQPGDALPHVFMTYGLGDSYSPPATMRAYAHAAGLTQVKPVLEDVMLTSAAPPLSGNATAGADANRTLGLRQYKPAMGDDGHFVASSTDLGRQDVLRFLLQALAGQTPAIGTP